MKALPTSYSEAIALGREFYRTGKPCKLGNIAPRRTGNRCCTCAEHRAANSRRLIEHRRGNDEWNAYVREYRARRAAN